MAQCNVLSFDSDLTFYCVFSTEGNWLLECPSRAGEGMVAAGVVLVGSGDGGNPCGLSHPSQPQFSCL